MNPTIPFGLKEFIKPIIYSIIIFIVVSILRNFAYGTENEGLIDLLNIILFVCLVYIPVSICLSIIKAVRIGRANEKNSAEVLIDESTLAPGTSTQATNTDRIGTSTTTPAQIFFFLFTLCFIGLILMFFVGMSGSR